MAITIGELIKFNNVESTDAIFGVLELPYFETPAYIPGVTYNTDYDEFILGNNGRGSQVVIRELGKGTAERVKVNTSNALKFNHNQTADAIRTVNLDNVIKQSEEVYQAVEVARQSGEGARKAEVLMNNIMSSSQELISETLVEGALPYQATAPATLTVENIKKKILDGFAKIDKKPNVLVVDKTTYALLLELVTSGDFLSYQGFNSIHTGAVGHILGMDVFIDNHLTVPFVMYDKTFLRPFTLLNSFDVVAATDFVGSYIRGMLIQGVDAPIREKTNGAWAVKYAHNE